MYHNTFLLCFVLFWTFSGEVLKTIPFLRGWKLTTCPAIGPFGQLEEGALISDSGDSGSGSDRGASDGFWGSEDCGVDQAGLPVGTGAGSCGV